MPQLILTLILLLTTLPTLAQQPPADNAQRNKPNILLIVADDLGYSDLSIHGGSDIPTPHIDSIAKSGVRFTSGYVTCPVCSPTRAGLLTGRYQQRFGHEFNPGPAAAANFGLPLTETTLPAALKAAGYRTGMVGKWHLGNRDGFQPHQRGFDEFYGFLAGARAYLPPDPNAAARPPAPILRNGDKVGETDYLTDAFAREAVAFIDRHKKEPFFLYLPFNAVHTPMHATEKYLSRFPRLEGKRKTYAAMLSAMDDAIGAALKKLRDERLEDNTLIIFISDNGGPPGNASSNGPLNGRKGTVYEGGIRVPFFLQWKGKIPVGEVHDPVASIDIFPTALAAASVAPPDGKKLDGVNLLPLFDGKNTAFAHDRLYWRFGPQWAIREGKWKLLKAGGANATPALYDLSADPGEKTDLSAANPDVVNRLQKAYDQWNAQNTEPLWKRQQRPRQQRQNRQPAPQAQ